MARLVILFTVISLILSVSHARLIKPESDPTTTNVIDLPSEKPDSESANVVDSNHEDASEADSELNSVPLTMISFRPVNGHFPRHPLIPFRHKHNCRHHKRSSPLNRRFQQKRYFSYGNDMILSDERTRSDSESSRLGPQILSRWDEHVDTYDHEHEQDHDGDSHHHRHHRRGEEDERHESEGQDGGFVERFRKFLINF